MPIQDFYPFRDNQKVTASMWNEIFDSIRDGTFFLSDEGIGEEISSLSHRVDVLEQEVNYLKQLKGRQYNRQQIVLAAEQTVIDLDYTPVLDSEHVYINGLMMSKSGLPTGFTGDYSIDGGTITMNPAWKMEIEAGDIMVITYQFEVNAYA